MKEDKSCAAQHNMQWDNQKEAPAEIMIITQKMKS